MRPLVNKMKLEYHLAEGEGCSESSAEEVSQRSEGDVDCTIRTTRSVFFYVEDGEKPVTISFLIV
jgi:hypothetical protein